MRVALVPTGKLEMRGLAKGLAGLFGGAWLHRDPAARNCSGFSEERAAEALVRLSWTDVLREPHHMRFARALICDLAEGLRRAPDGLDLTGDQAPLTSIHTPRVEQVLRNL